MKINRYIDHTLLKPETSPDQILQLCREAVQWDFYAVCVNSCYASLAKEALQGKDVAVACVVGFPLGACTSASKVFETREACMAGASEIDMVINIGLLKAGREQTVYDDIRAVVCAAGEYGAKVKVILETCLLTDDEIVRACALAEKAGAHFVKTSTGFSTGGATVRHVELMRSCVGDRLGVKASGGIRDLETALAMIKAGADRIGASAGVSIMNQQKRQE